MGFENALDRLLKHEGWYSNNPNDSGGETYRGISRNFYPKFGGWDIIDSYSDKKLLDKDERLVSLVSDFYYTYYWYKMKAEDIHDPFVAEVVFGFAVNMGKKQVVKKIQRILNVPVDGLIGNITIAAINNMDSKLFLYHFLLEIIEFYVQISKKGTNHVFLLGWLSRSISEYYLVEQHYK